MSYDEWEKRQQAKGSLPRRRPAARRASPRQKEPASRSSPINVVVPQRTFGEWIIAGIGIGLGMLLVSFIVGVLLMLFSLCTGAALLGTLG